MHKISVNSLNPNPPKFFW